MKSKVFLMDQSIIKLRSILILLCLLLFNVFSCTQIKKQSIYKNTIAGYSIELPETWEAKYYERSGLTLVIQNDREWKDSSTRLEIYGTACDNYPPGFDSSIKYLSNQINRIKLLYSLDDISVIDEPVTLSIGNIIFTTAMVEVPMEAISESKGLNLGKNKFQVIEIFIISNKENEFLMDAYYYQDVDQNVNNQAKAIVYSFKTICDGQY